MSNDIVQKNINHAYDFIYCRRCQTGEISLQLQEQR